MDYTNFSTRLPQSVIDALDAEAAQQCRSRNQMLLTIMVERYKITLSKPPSRSRAAPQAKRKTKQKAEVN